MRAQRIRWVAAVQPGEPAARAGVIIGGVTELTEALVRARAALKSGNTQAAVAAYLRAEELSPRDPELPHERGLALLETGAVGLAALAQRKALGLDPEHVGARAQLAAALEALGDDAGAAAALRELLQRLGPQPALAARLSSLEGAADRAKARRLLGNAVSRLRTSSLLGTALAR